MSEGRAMVEGEWAGRVTGLGDQSVEIAMLVTPDGHSRLELSQFIRPEVVSDHRAAQVNALGYLRAMFAVEDIDEMVIRLKEKHGAQLVGEADVYVSFDLRSILNPLNLFGLFLRRITTKTIRKRKRSPGAYFANF